MKFQYHNKYLKNIEKFVVEINIWLFIDVYQH